MIPSGNSFAEESKRAICETCENRVGLSDRSKLENLGKNVRDRYGKCYLEGGLFGITVHTKYLQCTFTRNICECMNMS